MLPQSNDYAFNEVGKKDRSERLFSEYGFYLTFEEKTDLRN